MVESHATSGLPRTSSSERSDGGMRRLQRMWHSRDRMDITPRQYFLMVLGLVFLVTSELCDTHHPALSGLFLVLALVCLAVRLFSPDPHS